MSLTGTIEGATWLGERTIRFDFDESSSSASGDGSGSEGDGNGSADDGSAVVNPANFPTAGDTYQGCYVLASVVATDGESAELTLLSPNERRLTGVAGTTVDYMQARAAENGTDDISGWRLMALAEARLFQAAHSALGIANDRNYLLDDDGTLKQILMSTGEVKTPTTAAVYLRPVVTVTINNE